MVCEIAVAAPKERAVLELLALRGGDVGSRPDEWAAITTADREASMPPMRDRVQLTCCANVTNQPETPNQASRCFLPGRSSRPEIRSSSTNDRKDLRLGKSLMSASSRAAKISKESNDPPGSRTRSGCQ